MENKTYDKLKYVVTIGLPALTAFVAGLGKLYGWEDTELATVTLSLLTTFFATLLGVSSNNYQKEE